MSTPRKLADFSIPIPLYCHHCDRRLPKSASIEVHKPFVIVHCPKCKCMTPFKVEDAA